MSYIFLKSRQAHILKGLGPACQNGFPITNCHYANDTILFLEADESNVEYAWWTMLVFALSLPKNSQTAFLILFSAFCWTQFEKLEMSRVSNKQK